MLERPLKIITSVRRIASDGKALQGRLQDFLSSGVEGSKVRRLAARALRRGRPYLHGTTADMMVHVYILDTLHRAVDLWRTSNLRSYAQVKVNDLLAHIPYDLFDRLPWVSELCRQILLSAEEEGDDLPQRHSQSSAPSPEPAADAVSSAAQPQDDVVQNVSARLTGVWKTKEFFVTIQRLRGHGECKLTLWAAKEQCRLRQHAYIQRLRHLHSMGDPDEDPDERERWSAELLGFGALRLRESPVSPQSA